MTGAGAAPEAATGSDRIVTVPNAISLIRLAGIPFFVWLLAVDKTLASAFTLAVVAGTDWVDGGLARRWNQVTKLGRILDPTIDRLLLVTAFTGALIVEALPLWLGTLLLVREVLIGLGAITLWRLGVTALQVTRAGKLYTFGVMMSLPLFLAADTSVSWADIAHVSAWLIAIPSLVLSWVTAFDYFREARHSVGNTAATNRSK